MNELSAGAAQAMLRPFRFFESRDLDHTRDRIASVFCPHSLLPHGAARTFQTRMDLLTVGGLGFGSIHLGGAMSVDVPEMSDCYLLLFCLSGTSEVVTDGAELTLSGWRGFACNPGQQFQARFSADAEQFFVRIDRRILWRHTGVRQLRLQSQVDLGRAALAPAEALIRMLLSSAGAIGLTQSNPRVAAEYEQLLLSLLLAGQPHADQRAARGSGIAPATVRRAEEFIRRNAASPLALEDVAAAAGVPVRTLLDGFRRFRDTSPMKLLREIRLDQARDVLTQDGAASVADVAMGCGFGHLGRFAQAYASRFGERPSDTRVRRRRRA